jgi:hypothetical protein
MPTNLAEKRTFVMPTPPPGKALLAEKYGPAIAGVGWGVIVLWIPSLWVLRASWQELLLDKTVDVELGLLAGLIAIVAFLPAIEDKTVIRKLKQWGWYRYLVGYLKEAIWVSALTMLLSLVFIVLPDGLRKSARLDRILSSVWWGLLLYSVAAALRIVRLSIKSLLAE